MSKHDEDEDLIETAEERIRKSVFLSTLGSDDVNRVIKAMSSDPDHPLNKPIRSVLTSTLIREAVVTGLVPAGAFSNASDVLALVDAGLSERKEALERKWRLDFYGKSTPAANESPTVDESTSVVEIDPPVDLSISPPADVNSQREQLIVSRKLMLAEYKAATGHTSQTIYFKATAAKAHSCHKESFYDWLRGDLPPTSLTAQSLELFLTNRPHFDLHAARRAKKRK